MRPTEYTADRLAALTGRDLWDATRDLCGTGVLDIARLEICARELMRPGWVLVRLVDGDPEYGKWECRDGDCSWRVDADDDDPAVAICRVACIVALRESDAAEGQNQ